VLTSKYEYFSEKKFITIVYYDFSTYFRKIISKIKKNISKIFSFEKI